MSSDGEETTKYGEEEYWDDRYGTWAPDPYDWLFEWNHVSEIVEFFVPKHQRIVLPGCGNANLSPDMFDAGYKNQLNFDTSSVVIEQMKVLHKERVEQGLQYAVMDATNLQELSNESFDGILDKSLIDTLRCCTGSCDLCKTFVDEMFRILKPRGYYITLSLNEYNDEDMERYYKCPEYDWEVAWVHLANPNYDPAKENTETYTMIVCRKGPSNGATPLQQQLEAFEPENFREQRWANLKAEQDAGSDGTT